MIEADNYKRILSPLDEHYILIGRCINEWAHLEESLLAFCQLVLQTPKEVTAIVFYHNVNLRPKLDLVRELMAFALSPAQHAEWLTVAQRVEVLSKIRNRIAHQVSSENIVIYLPADGDAKVVKASHRKERSRYDAARPRFTNKAEPVLDTAALYAHLKDVHEVQGQLSELLGRITEHNNRA